MIDPGEGVGWVGRLADGLAVAVTRYRRWVLLVCAGLILVAAWQVSRLKAEFNPADLFGVSEADEAAAEAFDEIFGQTHRVVVVLVEGSDVLGRETLQYIHDLSLYFRQQSYADRVDSLTVTPVARARGPGELAVGPLVGGDEVDPADVAEIVDAARWSRFVRPRLLSTSGHVAAIIIALDPSFERVDQYRPAVRAVQAELASLPAPSGVRARVGGIPYLAVEIVSAFTTDQVRLIPLTLVASLLVLFLFLRWVLGTLLPGLVLVSVVVLVAGGMAAVGEPINIINQVVPALIIVIGLSDSVHLLNRFVEETRRVGRGTEAIRAMVRSMAVACFLTSATTAIGFASLLLAHTHLLQRFGVTAAAAVMIAYVVTITFLPAVIAWARPPRADKWRGGSGWVEGWLEAFTSAILRHPVWVLGGCAVVVGGAVVAAVNVTIDTRLLEYFDEHHPVHQTTHLIDTDLGGVQPVDVSLVSDEPGGFDGPEVLNALQRVRDWALEQPGVVDSTCYADYLHEAWVVYTDDESKRSAPFESTRQVAALASLLEASRPSPIDPWVTLDRRQARLNVQMADVGAVATLELARRLERQLDHELNGFDGVSWTLTGGAYIQALGLEAVIGDMLGSFGTAFLVIFLVLFLLLRNVRLALVSIPPNVIPILVTLAYMTVRGIELNTINVVVFAISIGLAVDDTIHVLARFREERRAGYDVDEALRRTARGAGRAVVATSCMLAVGLMVINTSSFLAIRRFSELLTVTVVGALFADLIVLPALVAVAVRRDQKTASSETQT